MVTQTCRIHYYNHESGEILNSQLNSLEKISKQHTVCLCKLLIMRWGKLLLILGMMKKKEKMFRRICSYYKKCMNHCETYNEIIHQFVKSNFNSAETVIRVINEHFDHYQISWEFVVCVFVLIDILVRKEGRIALENEEYEY